MSSPTGALQRPPRLPPALVGEFLPAPQLLAGRLAASTVALYTWDCAAYVTFAGYDSTVVLAAETLRRWRTYLVQDTVLSPHTINRMLAAVKRVIREGAVQGLVAREVAEAFRQVEGVSVAALRHRLKAQARVRITPAQMRQLCEAPALQTLLGVRDRALLLTLATSGCRISEVVALTPAQVTPRDGSYFLQVLGKRQHTPREAPLSQEAAAAIQAWLAQRGAGRPDTPLFTRFAGGGWRPTTQLLSISSAWRVVRKYALQCGLPHVKPHDFRRFVGTELAKRDLRQAQKALGHQRLETTVQHYVLDELQPGLTEDLF
jgi:integrase/recombinase XerD